MSETVKHTDMLEQGMFLRDYRIDGYLASGGFGNTYHVTHTQLQESFAIKEFFMKGVSERGEDSTSVRISNIQNRNQFESQLRKFKKEALRLRQMHNEHIVRVHDLFESNGTAYYVMDLIDGESLAARLRREGRPMTEAEVTDILHQLLDALEAVHAAGFQHLDLKPANVMIDRDGQITLIDFGASKQFDSEDGASTSSAMAYTPGYAPREQVEQNISKLGPWTDLYALGATLYNLLTTHKPPLTSDIDDEGEQAFYFPKEVSKDMRALILWMMTPRRELRPQSVADVRKRLATTSGEDTIVKPLSLRPAPSPKPTPKSISEKNSKPALSPRSNPDNATPSPWKAKLLAIIAAAVILGVALIWWSVNRGDESTRAETAVTAISATSNSDPVMTFTANGVSFKMIKVESGTFMMGSNSGNSDEIPVHQVTLTNDYYIGETEVTQALWKAVMGSEPTADGGWEEKYGRGDRYPAYRFSWDDCQKFIKKLNALTGKKFRLPTESEWEFAARGGNASQGYTYSGSNTLSDVAWYTSNSGSKTHEVAMKAPNELGIYDMSGNVSEWCQDWYGSYSRSAQTNPTGPTSALTALDVVAAGAPTAAAAAWLPASGTTRRTRTTTSACALFFSS